MKVVDDGELAINGTVIDFRAGDGNRTPEDAAFLLVELNGEDIDLLEAGIFVETAAMFLFSFPDIMIRQMEKTG